MGGQTSEGPTMREDAERIKPRGAADLLLRRPADKADREIRAEGIAENGI